MNKWVAMLMLLIAGTIMWMFTPAPEPVNEWKPATPDRTLNNVPKVDIAPKKVRVYSASAKTKLKLPPAVQDDPHTHVLGSARLPKDTHPQTVVTTINEQTGEVQTYTRREPLPWLAVEQTGELRLGYGIKNGMARAVRLTLREDLLQVKALHAGINASIDTDGQYFAGVGVGWRW